MNLPEAMALANEVKAAIAPLCVLNDQGVPLCEIAGSVRRSKLEGIKDVELVAVPANKHLFTLAGIVNRKWGPPAIGDFPSKYTRIRNRVNLDLFWATRENFGLNFFIRTGSADFAAKALLRWKRHSGGGHASGAQLYDGKGILVPTPTEQDVFNALGWRFVEPKDRL